MKKRIFTLLTVCAFFYVGQLKAQVIPNYSFETWDDSTGVMSPTKWMTSDQLFGLLDPTCRTVTKSTSPYTGSYAMQLRADSFTFLGVSDLVPAFAATNFAINFRPAYLIGFYKGNFQMKDSAIVVVGFSRTDSLGNNDTLGAGATLLAGTSSASGYQMFSIPINYTKSQNPDSAEIFIGINTPDSGSAAGTLIVDQLAFTNSVGISEYSDAIATTIYPNPAKETANLKILAVKSCYATIDLLDLSGKVIREMYAGDISSGKTDLNLDINGLKPGSYLCKINLNGESKIQKLIITE